MFKKIGVVLILCFIFNFAPMYDIGIPVLNIGTFLTDLHAALIPKQINYQGRLADGNGNPVTGTKSMTFSFFNDASGGTALWSETQSVDVSAGLFNVQIGKSLLLGTTVFENASSRYLEVTIETKTLSPRVNLVSVPFAYIAEKSYTCENVASSFFSTIPWTTDGTNIWTNKSGSVGISSSPVSPGSLTAKLAVNPAITDTEVWTTSHAKTVPDGDDF